MVRITPAHPHIKIYFTIGFPRIADYRENTKICGEQWIVIVVFPLCFFFSTWPSLLLGSCSVHYWGCVDGPSPINSFGVFHRRLSSGVWIPALFSSWRLAAGGTLIPRLWASSWTSDVVGPSLCIKCIAYVTVVLVLSLHCTGNTL